MTCEKCNSEINIGDYPFCPHGPTSVAVLGDDIPGGLEIKHGIPPNPDGTPRKFYSKSAIRKAAAEHGWTISGETPKPNSRITERKQMEAERKRC